MKKEFLVKEGNEFLIEVEFDEHEKPPTLEDYLLEDYEDEKDRIDNFKDDLADWESTLQYEIKKIFISENDKKIRIKGFLEDVVSDDDSVLKKLEDGLKVFLKQ
jgi:hypothetical protein